MNTSNESTDLQLPCSRLRSKEMFHQAADQKDDQFTSGIYWCTQTHENFGPDGQPCGKTECCAGRGCYLS